MAHNSGHTATATIGRDRYTTIITAGGHDLVSDEPRDLEGQDAGPTPYGFLLAALGACKTITARMYADRKGWDLEAVHVELRHDRVTGDEQHEIISVKIHLSGNLTDEQRTRIKEIAGRCPVHRTITGDLRIQSQLV